MSGDQGVPEKYRKIESDEHFLSALNDSLYPAEVADYQDFQERLPTLHVVGVPRSGTTLLLQVIAAGFNIGYINNLIARFWKAPVTGIRLANTLNLNNQDQSFHSDFGRTSRINEPHEFGYFWARLLGNDEMLQPEIAARKQIDWPTVGKIIINMCEAFNTPIVFKSFLLQWHIPDFIKQLPKSCFVRIRRDPIDNAMSLLKMRREFTGSIENWVSMKPREYHWLKRESPWVQVAGQVYYLDSFLDLMLRDVDRQNQVEVTLQALLSNPDDILTKIGVMMHDNGSELERTKVEFPRREEEELSTEQQDDRGKIADAYGKFMDGHYE
jgi:hypothetical protein